MPIEMIITGLLWIVLCLFWAIVLGHPDNREPTANELIARTMEILNETAKLQEETEMKIRSLLKK